MGSNMGARMHSYPLYQDLQQKAEPFSEVICRRMTSASVSVDNSTERVEAEMVSGNYFSMLGVPPAIGRVFSSREDDQAYQGHPVVVLSYGYWLTRFARDPNVVGKTIRVNDYPMTIVGVSAEGFAGLDPTQSPQIRVPIQMKPVMAPDWGWLHMDSRRARWVQVFARLKPGYTVESAGAPAQGLFTQIRAYEMTLPEAKDWSAYNRDQFMKGRLLVAGADLGYSPMRNNFSTALIVLMCMVGLVLLIACANVANRLHAAEGNRRAAVARIFAAAIDPSVARGKSGAVGCRRNSRACRRVRADPRPARVSPYAGTAAAGRRKPGSADSCVHLRAHGWHRNRVRLVAGAARQPH
jgi:hypothetical protein